MIDLFYDLIDKAAIILYRELKISYLDALYRISSDLCVEFNPARLSPDAVKNLEALYREIKEHDFAKEDVRIAWRFLCIKALKEINYNLDVVIPDVVGLLFAYLIASIFKDSLDLLNIRAGCGDLANFLKNNLKRIINIAACDDDEKMLKLTYAGSLLQDNHISLCYQTNSDLFDVVCGNLIKRKEDLDIFSEIKERLANIKQNGIFIFLVQNDFFKHDLLKNGGMRIYAAMLLPVEMFKEKDKSCSIIIGGNKKTSDEMILTYLKYYPQQYFYINNKIQIDTVIKKIKEVMEK